IPVVAVRSEVQGAEAAALAGGLAADLSQLAANHAAELAVVDAPQSDSADYLLRVAAGRSSTALHAELTLISRASGELLWSASVDSPLNALVDLRQQLAVRTADVLLCALHGTRVNGDRLDTATLRLFLTFCENDHDEHDSRQLDVIRQVTARAPDFAAGWADLAVTEAYLGQPGSESGFRDFPAKAAFRAASRDHLLRARAMDPALSGTYFAEALLVIDPQQWSRRLAIIDRGIIVTSDASLYDLRSDDLGRVGRLNEAVDSARNAVELDPLSPAHRRTLAGWLAYSGRIEAANLVIREMERTWPGSEVSRAARFNFDLRFGNARHALAMLDDGDNDRLSPQARDLDRLFLRARIDSSAANIQSVLGAIGPGLPDASPISYLQLQALGYFGQIDKAYALLNAPAFRARLLAAPDILFRTQMRSIVRDPRFLPLSRRMGLLDYWRRTGQWPDFCAEPGLPYDCRAEAARLAA
ncbi:MAG: hypothetical protein JWP15_2766, partial [Alphaproteobacteria bacterium]|nr:hypothetical protein [Alphaproteobacteria bacterium]